MRPYKIAVLLTHPVQYFSPFFKAAAANPDLDLTVYYCSSEGSRLFYDREFHRRIKWDIPLLEGYRSVFLRNYSFRGGVNHGFTGLLNLGLPRQLIAGHYDLVLVHGWNYFTAWLAFFTAILYHIPFAVRGESPLNQELLKSKWKLRLKKFVLGFIFKRMQAAMAIGTQNAGFYRHYGVPEDKIKLMPYAVDNDLFISSAASLRSRKDELKKQYGIPLDKVIVNFTGKLSPKKRPQDILAAFSAVPAQDKALIFVGDGRLLEELRLFAANKKIKDIYFLGFKNQSEISQLYALSDIFVLPSGAGETWGLVVNEAMCFSLPVIVSDIAGCGFDLVRSGENGFIFEQGNLKQLTQQLEKLITDPFLRNKMGERSLSRIKNWGFKQDLDAVFAAKQPAN